MFLFDPEWEGNVQGRVAQTHSRGVGIDGPQGPYIKLSWAQRAKAQKQIKPIRQISTISRLFKWVLSYYPSSYPNLVSLKGVMTLETKEAHSVLLHS